MTGKDSRIVGALSRLNHPVERLPPGFIALFVWTPNVYRWEVIRAVDVVRVREGDTQGRRPQPVIPGCSPACWMRVQVVVAGTTFNLDTATMQEVLDALTAGLRSTVPEGDMPWDATAPFGAYLRRIRTERGWTAREVSDKLKCSRAYVSALESRSRRRPPTMELLQRISHGYGLDIQDVLREAGFRHVGASPVGGGGT